MKPIISVRGLGKQYRIRTGEKKRYYSLRDDIAETAHKLLRGKIFLSKYEYLWAVKNIQFDVYPGEVVGIIGRNGAGKSTLLKILSRITQPTTGEAILRGRVGSLLEVGAGFHPELTGRENIFMNGTVLGMKRTEIERKFDEIVAFAGVDKFLDTPVKRYSSGMYVRLAFAVAAHLEPQILLVDEVLAVGDIEFQKKCLGKMEDVATKEGRTILFVSHNMAAVEKLCRHGIVLDRGEIGYIGRQTDAITHYLKNVSGIVSSLEKRIDRKGSGEVRVVAIEFRDTSGNLLEVVKCGQDIDIYFHFEANLSFSNSGRVTAGMVFKTELEVPVFQQNNKLTAEQFGELPRSGAFVCRLTKLPLPPSTYKISYNISLDGTCLDNIINAATITVVEGDFFGTGVVPPISHGVCLVQGKWSMLSH
jgi:lipopolysaccharide transport system ATP-binding protein